MTKQALNSPPTRSMIAWNKLSVGLILLVCWANVATAQTYTWPDNGHTYTRIGPCFWFTCYNQAIASGGMMVTINDADENAMLTSQFSNLNDFWIGYTDFASEGTWVWASGETPSYTNWTSGEPNNQGGDEDYATFQVFNGGSWNDYYGGNQLYAVVEYVPTPTPTPTATATPTITPTPTATSTPTPTPTATPTPDCDLYDVGGGANVCL